MTKLIPPKQVGERLWALGGYYLNIYLIRHRDQAALFEVGTSVSAPIVLAQLNAVGVAPEEVRWIILTHAHSDHAPGAWDLLTKLPRARLLLTSETRSALSQTKVLERFSRDNYFCSTEVAKREGLAPTKAWPPLEPLSAERMDVAQSGQRLTVGEETIDFLDATGHVHGGLAAWLPNTEALLASDSAGFRQAGGCGYPLYFTSYQSYQDNLASMASRKPQILALGHQGFLTGPEIGEYFEATAFHLKKYQTKIVNRFRSGHALKQINDWLMDTFYRDEMTIYNPDNIIHGCNWLIKRSLQHANISI